MNLEELRYKIGMFLYTHFYTTHLGLLLVSGGVFISNLPSSVPPDGEQRRRRSSLSDPLITENTPSEVSSLFYLLYLYLNYLY